MKSLRAISVIMGAAFALAVSSAQAAIKTQYVEYMHGSTPLKGYLAYDDSKTGKRPGVLLVHYRGGLQGETLKDAEMIAGMGYVVFAEDIFGKDVVPKTVPEMTKLTDVYNNDRALMRTRSASGFDVLAKNAMVDASKIAIIGYCFGGTVAVELAETGVPESGTGSLFMSVESRTGPPGSPRGRGGASLRSVPIPSRDRTAAHRSASCRWLRSDAANRCPKRGAPAPP